MAVLYNILVKFIVSFFLIFIFVFIIIIVFFYSQAYQVDLWLVIVNFMFDIEKKIQIWKKFHRFRGFALHYESTVLAENRWQDLVLILGNRLDYFLSELKLISNLQNQQKIESWQLFDWKITTEVTGYKNW